ncbi:MAG: TenA family protein [Halobacteriota archaeon]
MSDVPDRYEAYVEAADDPRFTEWLRLRSEPEWSAAVEHPWTNALGANALSEEAFRRYLLQDYAFLGSLVSAFGYAVGDAPDVASKRRLVAFLDTLTDEENDYFERSFDALDVPAARWQHPTPTATTAAFVDLLGRASREGGYAETLAVLVPAEWVYAEWATAVATERAARGADAADAPFYVTEWIDLHAIDPFLEFVAWLKDQLDEVGPTLSPRRQARVDRLFGRTVALEVAFFDAAFDAPSTTDRTDRTQPDGGA